MTERPLVSVIIPAYGAAETILEAIASVREQTISEFEIIVVDDASPDDTAAKVGQIGDPRLRLLRHERNAGAAAARNTAIKAATGKYIAFLDADDIWLPNKLARQLAWAETAAKDQRALCASFRVDVLSTGTATEYVLDSRANLNRQMLDGCFVSPGSTLFVERDAFLEIGFFDTEMKRLEDWDWLLRYSMRYRLSAVPEILAVIRLKRKRYSPAVAQAVRILWQRHCMEIRSVYGAAAADRFRASLRIEQAAAVYREGQLLRCLGYLCMAALAAPRRVYDFVVSRLHSASSRQEV